MASTKIDPTQKQIDEAAYSRVMNGLRLWSLGGRLSLSDDTRWTSEYAHIAAMADAMIEDLQRMRVRSISNKRVRHAYEISMRIEWMAFDKLRSGKVFVKFATTDEVGPILYTLDEDVAQILGIKNDSSSYYDIRALQDITYDFIKKNVNTSIPR